MKFQAFAMERWQSTYEHTVRFNLSESGVEPLTLGELIELANPDPGELRDTLIEYNPSDGSPALRSAIADMYSGATPNNVVVTNGGAEANFVTSWVLCEPGDDVLYLAPNYMQVPGMAANWGCTARPLHLREKAGWQPDPEDLSALVTDATKLILVTNPNNPTGTYLEKNELLKLRTKLRSDILLKFTSNYAPSRLFPLFTFEFADLGELLSTYFYPVAFFFHINKK